MSNEISESRREDRRGADHAITFSLLNRRERYIGVARNISRSGMMFHSSRKLKPGTCIVILPLNCPATDHLWGDGECDSLAASMCSGEGGPGRDRQYFLNMVTAQVTRCESLETTDRLRFTVAVDYLRPAV